MDLSNNITNFNIIKENCYLKHNSWTKDKSFIYLKIKNVKKHEHEIKIYCILPKQSIRILLNNYINDFEWEFYLKCLHRFDIKDKSKLKNCNTLQSLALVKNLKTKKEKRGKPKKRSRPILINTYKEKNKNLRGEACWKLVTFNEYNKFCMIHKINKFINFMYKDKYNIPNDIYRNIYKYII